MMAERWYFVVGPEEETVIPILDDGTGPIEVGCSVWEGYAQNAKEAKRLAWRYFREQGAKFLDDNYPGHPMRGVKVERVPPCVTHGYDFDSCEPVDCWPVPCSACPQDIEIGSSFAYNEWGEETHLGCVAIQ
jgi:hypothetical protein